MSCPRHLAVLLAILPAFIPARASLGLDAPAIKQNDAPLVESASGELPAPEIIARARAAYRSGPVGERVTISVREGQVTRFDEFVVRLRADDQRREMRLDLAALSIWTRTDGAAGEFTAQHRENDELVYRASLDRPLSRSALRAHLPTMLAPQLALAFGERLDASISDDDWTRGPPAPDRHTIIGATALGLTTIAFDAETFRLREYAAQSRDLTIRLRVEAIEAGDPDSWVIDAVGSRVVSSLSELRPRVRPVPIGEEFPFRTLQDATMSPWLLDAALANRRVPPQRPEERYLVLVFHRVPSEVPARTHVLDRVGRAIDAAGEVERELARTSMRPEGLGPRRAIVRVIVRPVACLRVPEARREVIQTLAARWPLDTGGSGLLWTVSPEQTLDRLAPGASAAIAIIDEQRRLVRVLEIDDEFETDALSQQIRDTVMREVNLIGGP